MIYGTLYEKLQNAHYSATVTFRGIKAYRNTVYQGYVVTFPGRIRRERWWYLHAHDVHVAMVEGWPVAPRRNPRPEWPHPEYKYVGSVIPRERRVNVS